MRNLLLIITVLLGFSVFAGSEKDIVFPPGSGVFDVVKDGGVDNTGKTDCTAKLNKILSQDFAKRIQTVYFPKGTYLVSGMIRGKQDPSRSNKSHSRGPWVIGESKKETIIRLKDGTWSKELLDSSVMTTKALAKRIDTQSVWHTGDCSNTTFNKVIRNLTINTGKNNPGAIGLTYIVSNNGIVQDVDIISEDGKGSIGMAFTGKENGPGGAFNVHIKGFKRGLYSTAEHMMAVSNLTVDGAREAGVINTDLMVIENLKVNMAGSGPAVYNTKRNGNLGIINGDLKGSGKVAIQNDSKIFVRNIKTSGFEKAIACPNEKTPAPTGTDISEYYSGASAGLFTNHKKSLNLPIKQYPEPAWEKDFSKWTNVKDFKTDSNSWHDALKVALAQKGKTHLIVPYVLEPHPERKGKTRPLRIQLEEDLIIGNDFTRVIGTGGGIVPKKGTNAKLIVGDGSAPVVAIEYFSFAPTIEVKTGRTVLLNRISAAGWRKNKRVHTEFIANGAGDVFINDTGTSIVVKNPKQNVWMRHYNHEAKTLAVTVEAGSLWILGWKSENLFQRAKQNGGKFELFGFDSYEVGKDKATTPIVEINGGDFSAALTIQRGSRKYNTLFTETREGKKKALTAKEHPDHHNCLLYTGYK